VENDLSQFCLARPVDHSSAKVQLKMRHMVLGDQYRNCDATARAWIQAFSAPHFAKDISIDEFNILSLYSWLGLTIGGELQALAQLETSFGYFVHGTSPLR
jgi:hypothetical protein